MDVFFTCLLFLQKRITLTRAFCNSKQHSPLAARSTPLPVPQNQSESGGRHWAGGKGQPWRGRMIEGLKGLSSVVGIQARPIDYAKMIKRACDLPTAPLTPYHHPRLHTLHYADSMHSRTDCRLHCSIIRFVVRGCCVMHHVCC